MWLALQGQDPVTVRAEAGPHWAEATVTLVSTTWDMGNGDVVECDGAGVPIVDFDTPDEGPCGYTYRVSAPEDDPYELSVAATWQVTYQSSGGSGTAGSITRTADRHLRRRRDPDHRHLQLTVESQSRRVPPESSVDLVRLSGTRSAGTVRSGFEKQSGRQSSPRVGWPER